MGVLFVTSTRIGDAILSSGLLAHLLERHPQEPVTVACGSLPAPLFEAVPRLERILVIEKRRGGGHWLDLWRNTVGRRWRVVVDLRRSMLRHLLLAEERFGLPADGAGTHRVPLISRTLLLPPQPPVLWTGPAHEREAGRMIGGEPPFIAIAPTANWRGKMWPAERFVEAAERLTAPGAAFAGHRVLVTAAAPERGLAQPVLSALPPGQSIDAVGASLPLTGALFRRAALFLGNDSGLMHLSAAAGTPTVGLFGPTDDRLYRPWGVHGLAVRTPESYEELVQRRRDGDDDDRCLMTGLSVDTVVEAVGERFAA
ncbi:MAG: glycosyltransferase family 9 protein [Acetobacterales bacterium]